MAKRYQIGAVVLAAGLSKRAGPENKLLNLINGKVMVQQVVENIVSTGITPIIVVTGHQAGEVQNALKALPVEFTHNPGFADGMGSSIAQGVSALPDDVDGVLICLGDMPHIKAETFNCLLNAIDPDIGREICVPVLDGRRGNPVLFGRSHFHLLREIEGDQGAKKVTLSQAANVVEVSVEDNGIFIDYDTNPQSAE